MREPGGPALPIRGSGPGTKGLVVGVDGGGTGSRALILDADGGPIAGADGPPALVLPSDPSRAAEAIKTTVEKAADLAECSLPVDSLWAGLAGAGRAGEREAVEIALRSLGLARVVKVGMDVEGAHQDAFGGGPGVLLVVGTGSMAWGKDPSGAEIRVGGWGALLGDEGSGYWLGLEGLRAVARAADDRGPSTVLTRTLLSALHLPDPAAMIPWAARASKGEIGALAPLVLKAAETGDPGASEALKGGLEALLRHLEVIRTRWPSPEEPIPLALVGGLVEEEGPLRVRLETLVHGIGGRLVSHPVVPVRGAARLARSLVAAE